MKIKKYIIEKFRSIKHVELFFPDNKPVILFGPNNVGKSNIMAALDCMLGEKYAAYYDFEDSDYHLRKRDIYPNISFTAHFDDYFYSGTRYQDPSKTICFSTNKMMDGKNENIFHYPPNVNNGKKIFLSNEDRENCQIIYVDATRDISRQLSYYNQYSILSKLSKKMHSALKKAKKDELDIHFQVIKASFESVPEFNTFQKSLQQTFEKNIEGFEHKLDIDLSAYDPNNYFHSLRIVAKEGSEIRAFDEFGSGEQQILLLAFVKAYADTFKGSSFILAIEEPEAHLHPIAQRWLAKNLCDMTNSGIQVIISTHSPEFLNIDYLDGFVKVFKENNITKVIQHTAQTLSKSCVDLKADYSKCTEDSVLKYYKTKTFYDQLRGFFASKILLVEGETEYFALPNYFKNLGYNLIKNGVEIVNCRGKNQIIRNYRLFKSYGYECFCLFDADENDGSNSEFVQIFGIDEPNMDYNGYEFTYDSDKKYGYFGTDFETYLRCNLPAYVDVEESIHEGKVLKAKIISEEYQDYRPEFIVKIAESLNIKQESAIPLPTYIKREIDPDDLPF